MFLIIIKKSNNTQYGVNKNLYYVFSFNKFVNCKYYDIHNLCFRLKKAFELSIELNDVNNYIKYLI